MQNIPNPFDGDITDEAILAWLERRFSGVLAICRTLTGTESKSTTMI